MSKSPLSNLDNNSETPSLENQEFRRVYKNLDQLILILLILVLPLFGMIYLYQSSGEITWDLPELPMVFGQILSGAGIGLLLAQYLLFRKKIKAVFHTDELLMKLKIYASATRERYLILFVIALICSAGLLFFGSAIYNVIFAVALFFFSVAKPTPERITKLLKLSKEDAEVIRLASRPE
ncbi:hypothetical protein SAMN04489724_2665 [Algoriphagus locisalis]|uniref:Uncharacterized protein n=1 Tax=Algoriphagus locisalis TaxID=305507 RepID=A0A1I7BSK9_9BACT|nr:hypothetical protein [Algoriphagus locisalis]SFT90172.1 hypothetical protein SAMN04489724_2665 [Algoriphagus locisalis]